VAKKIEIGVRPTARANPDDWVSGQQGKEPLKRLTIDLPRDLHTRVKVRCAQEGTKMSDKIRELLEREFPA
jgi:hypothetical protein